MDFPISIIVLLIASTVVIIGAVLHGSLGFGLGTLSVPLLLLVDPILVPGPMLCLGFFIATLIYRREKDSVITRDLKWGILGRVLGAVAGVFVLKVVPEEYFPPMVGLVVLLALLLLSIGVHLTPNTRSLISIGTLSGLMGTTAAIGGPPMAMLYVDQKGPRIRGTLSGIFIFGTISALIALAFVGRFGRDEILIALSLVPALLIGFYLSRYSAALLDRGYIRPTILTVSGIAAVFTIVRHFV